MKLSLAVIASWFVCAAACIWAPLWVILVTFAMIVVLTAAWEEREISRLLNGDGDDR